MNVIVNDDGFAGDDWATGYAPTDDLAQLTAADKTAFAVDVDNTYDVADLLPWIDQIDMIRLHAPVFSDGRAFSQAHRLRMIGYAGRLRLAGHVLADQYAMARRSGFDEVEITPEIAARQPVAQWQARADWQAHDYQQHLRHYRP